MNKPFEWYVILLLAFYATWIPISVAYFSGYQLSDRILFIIFSVIDSGIVFFFFVRTMLLTDRDNNDYLIGFYDGYEKGRESFKENKNEDISEPESHMEDMTDYFPYSGKKEVDNG